jgi:hypothetical protein
MNFAIFGFLSINKLNEIYIIMYILYRRWISVILAVVIVIIAAGMITFTTIASSNTLAHFKSKHTTLTSILSTSISNTIRVMGVVLEEVTEWAAALAWFVARLSDPIRISQ